MRLKEIHKFSRAMEIKETEHYLVCTTGGKLNVYDKESYEIIESFSGMSHGYDIHVAPDENVFVVTACNSKHIYFFSLDNKENGKKLRICKGEEYVHEGEAALSYDGKRLYAIVAREECLCDKIVEIDLSTGKEIASYYAKDNLVFSQILLVAEGLYFVCGYERHKEDNTDFIGWFDGNKLMERVDISNDCFGARYECEKQVFTWYNRVDDSYMYYKRGEQPATLAKWYQSFEYSEYDHFYDVNKHYLYIACRKGIFVIDTYTNEIVDRMETGEYEYKFYKIKNEVSVLDRKGMLYQLTEIGENVKEKLPVVDRTLPDRKEEEVIFDFTISDEMIEKFQELREKFEIEPPYCIDKQLREEFLSDVRVLDQMGKRYSDSFIELKEEWDKRSCSISYGTLGSDMHRGFYCPSLVKEKVRYSRRGKLIKRLTANTERYYKYHFDKDGQLILVERYLNETCLEVEFLIYENGLIYGLLFDTRPMSGIERLNFLTMERLDKQGRLCRYIEDQFYAEKSEEREYCFLNYAEQYKYSGKEANKVTLVTGNLFSETCEADRYQVSVGSNGKYKVKAI